MGKKSKKKPKEPPESKKEKDPGPPEEQKPFDFGGLPQRDLKKNLGCG